MTSKDMRTRIVLAERTKATAEDHEDTADDNGNLTTPQIGKKGPN